MFGVTTGAMKRLGLLLLGSAACYSGDATLGGACERDADCGDAQACTRSICSLCDDGVAQSGELCFEGPLSTEAAVADASHLAVLDMNGDGRGDLVWPGVDALFFALNVEDGFDPAQSIPFDVTAVWSGDFDGDGTTELVVRDSVGGAGLWRADGAGGLVAEDDVDLEPARGLTQAVVDPGLGLAAVVGNTLVRVGASASASVELPANVTALAAAEANQQAITDFVVALDDDTLRPVFVSDDALSVQPPTMLGASAADLRRVRWNSDALDDVVTVSEGGTVAVFLSDGQGGLVEAASVQVPMRNTSVLVFDADDDLDDDVIVYGPQTKPSLLVRRGRELDDPITLDETRGAHWLAAVRVGPDPFDDLVRYDGAAFSVLRRNP